MCLGLLLSYSIYTYLHITHVLSMHIYMCDASHTYPQFEAEVYDLTSTLTPVQSRLEALRQKGLLG